MILVLGGVLLLVSGFCVYAALLVAAEERPDRTTPREPGEGRLRGLTAHCALCLSPGDFARSLAGDRGRYCPRCALALLEAHAIYHGGPWVHVGINELLRQAIDDGRRQKSNTGLGATGIPPETDAAIDAAAPSVTVTEEERH